jgi:hypothetical protein
MLMAETGTSSNASGEINRDLVRKVADEVYAMLKHELRIEYERRRVASKKPPFKQGGR